MFGKCAVILSLSALLWLKHSFLFRSTNMNAHTGVTSANETCSLEMYGNDTAAYWACAAQFAHQSNWFPSPIAGLYSYETWNGYTGFWQNGAVLETMINFVAYTNHTNTRYLSVVRAGRRSLDNLLRAYGPYPSFDDIGWYGLAFARIHEVLGDQDFLQSAIDIFDWCWKTGWDETSTCSGGFWFDYLHESKQTITNVLMLHLAARLYRFTNQSEYELRVKLIYQYIMYNQLIDKKTYLMSDGAKANCTPADSYGPTYNSGVMIGALAEMYRITKDTSLTNLAYKMAIAVFKFHCDKNGILVEYCEPTCDGDGIMFKGIFVRNVRYLMDVLDATRRTYLQDRLYTQIESSVKNNICDEMPVSKCNISFNDGPPYYKTSGPVFSPYWRGPFTYGAPMQQTSVMDLFIAAIAPGTVCQGQLCNYDPYFPPPKRLTCDNNPCPPGRECCEYKPIESYGCCAEGQRCSKEPGICI